jgi:L-rhamnose mutarotase
MPAEAMPPEDGQAFNSRTQLSSRSCQPMQKTDPIHGTTNPTPEDAARMKVKYYGSIIELRPEKEREYRELHADVWPEVREAIAKANIRNFNIYVTEIAGKRLLVSHFEYVGSNSEADFASIGNDPTTKEKWWPLTDACQIRLPETPEGSQWKPMEQVMHLD